MAHPAAEQQESAWPPAVESMTMLVAAVIVHDTAADRVLLLQRGPRAKFGRGRWDLPVGKSEPGEPITATAVRELFEETGVSVAVDDLRVVHVIHGARGVGAPNGFLTVIFAVERWTGQPWNREPAKHARVDWISTTAIPDEFVSATASALRRYLTNGPRLSLDGW